MEYGTTILSMAVIAIVLTAPTGAILINTLGPKWLSYDGEEEEKKPNFAASWFKGPGGSGQAGHTELNQVEPSKSELVGD